MYIWVRSRRCACLFTCFCYQMIAKPGKNNWPTFAIWPILFLYDMFIQTLNWLRRRNKNVLNIQYLAAYRIPQFFKLQVSRTNTFNTEMRLYQMNYVNNTAADFLAPWVTRTSTIILLNMQGFYSLRRHLLISIGIPIINLRWSSDHLRFIMGIPLPVRRHLQDIRVFDF